MSTFVRLTIDQFDRMISAGVFDEGFQRPRIELIDGELREMSPIGPMHESEVDFLAEWSFTRPLKRRIRVRVQNSIGLPELDSAPQPDLAWVARKDYSKRRPTAVDVLLIVEVADSSLDYDRGEKADLYAQTGIRDYWIVNIPDQCVEVYRDPENGRYHSLQTFRPGDDIHPLAFPDVTLSVRALFEADADS